MRPTRVTLVRRPKMSWFRVLLSVVAPPIAVIDLGLKPFLLTLLLTVIGWIPGVAAALVYNSRKDAPVRNHAF